MKTLRLLLISLALLFVGLTAHAQGSGGGGEGAWSFGFGAGIVNADQEDFNNEIKARRTVTSADEFGNAYEANIFLAYQITGSNVVMMLRPSIFTYKDQDGTAAKYGLTGYTIFPMLRWILLSDETIHFYSQIGVGYGHMEGFVEDAGQSVDFSGGDIGYLFGLGAEFCFFGSNHCFTVEGNVRKLSIDRMTVDKVVGDPTNTTNAGSTITQASRGREFEVNGRDFGTSMSGIVGLIGYAYHF